jgi:hypothetical protein
MRIALGSYCKISSKNILDTIRNPGRDLWVFSFKRKKNEKILKKIWKLRK